MLISDSQKTRPALWSTCRRAWPPTLSMGPQHICSTLLTIPTLIPTRATAQTRCSFAAWDTFSYRPSFLAQGTLLNAPVKEVLCGILLSSAWSKPRARRFIPATLNLLVKQGVDTAEFELPNALPGAPRLAVLCPVCLSVWSCSS